MKFLLAAIMLAMLSGTALADGLNQMFDLGDITGNYRTEVDPATSAVKMSAGLSLSCGSISEVSTRVAPSDFPGGSGESYFNVHLQILGCFDVLPGPMPERWQSFSLSHNGVKLNADCIMGAFKDEDTFDFWSSAGGSVTLQPFTAVMADANFYESEHNFSFNVIWTGFTSEAAAPTFGGLSPVSISTVPEPTSLCFFGLGAAGLLFRRRR